jgi:hypothetical protein
MTETKENMVLRTVYLPIKLDRELRQLAFSRDVSKADLIRDFIHDGLEKVETSGEKTLAARLEERIRQRDLEVETALSAGKKKTPRSASRRRAATRPKRQAVG